jgi:hypothetical protein
MRLISFLRPVTVAVAAVAVAVAGCTKSRSPVTGTVTYAGQPVDTGGIDFISADPDGSRFRLGGPIHDGKYAITADRGPFPGKYRVEITWMKAFGKPIVIDESGSDGGAKREIANRKQALPAKYNEKSELTAEITSGRNTVNFDLAP